MILDSHFFENLQQQIKLSKRDYFVLKEKDFSMKKAVRRSLENFWKWLFCFIRDGLVIVTCDWFHLALFLWSFVKFHICVIFGDNLIFPTALTKGQTTTAFLRVLKYSTGGVLEVIFHPFILFYLGHAWFCSFRGFHLMISYHTLKIQCLE